MLGQASTIRRFLCGAVLGLLGVGAWCGHARAYGGAWEQVVPGQLTMHPVVWDGPGDRLILAPGDAADSPALRGPLALSLAGPRAWSELADLPVQVGSIEVGMIHDASRERLVLYDGYRNQVWVLPLAPGSAWRRLTIQGGLPLPRSGFTLVLDAARDRALLYGGLGYGGSLRGEVWALPLAEPATWTEVLVPPDGAAPRHAHAAAFDPLSDRLLVFGGDLSSSWPYQPTDETWALEFAGDVKWTRLLSATTPAPRRRTSLVYDPRGRRMVLFGGWSGASVLQDIWTLSMTTDEWTPLAVAGEHPSGRDAHTATMDTLRHHMLVFGGNPGANETWALVLEPAPEWKLLSVLGAQPARSGHTLVADPAGRRLLMFGGRDSTRARNEVWQMRTDWDGLWLPVATLGEPPPPRWDHVGVMDTLRHRLLVHGGRDETGPLGDLWALELGDTARWRPLVAGGDPPTARFGHAGVIDAGGDALLIHGGDDGALCDDLYALPLGEPPHWSTMQPDGPSPGPRRDHTLVLDVPRHRLILFGGQGLDGALDDFWRLGLAGAPQWAPLAPTGDLPGPRRGHSALFDWNHHRMVLFGGDNGEHPTHRSYELKFFDTPPDSVACRELFPREPLPLVRAEHAVAQFPAANSYWLCGGADAGPFADTWRLDYLVYTPVTFAGARVEREAAGARLTWRLAAAEEALSFQVWREEPGRANTRLTADPLAVRTEGVYVDRAAPRGAAAYWLEELSAPQSVWHGPFALAAASLPVRPELRAAATAAGAVALSFDLPRPGHARLTLHDLRGRLVARLVESDLPAGSHAVVWDGRDRAGRRAASGVYCARLATEDDKRSVAVTLVR